MSEAWCRERRERLQRNGSVIAHPPSSPRVNLHVMTQAAKKSNVNEYLPTFQQLVFSPLGSPICAYLNALSLFLSFFAPPAVHWSTASGNIPYCRRKRLQVADISANSSTHDQTLYHRQRRLGRHRLKHGALSAEDSERDERLSVRTLLCSQNDLALIASQGMARTWSSERKYSLLSPQFSSATALLQ